MAADWMTPPKMTEVERKRISNFIEKEFGIRMPAIKQGLLEGRLFKRLRIGGFSSYGEYFDFVTQTPQGRDEYLYFIDLVSTHETSFFRENNHFQLLEKQVIPGLCGQTGHAFISVLSAACSTGEEAYSLAMIIDAAIQKYQLSDLTYEVEGVDISSKAVSIAQRGVYLADRIKTIPPFLAQRYLMASKDREKDLFRIVPELRSHMVFHTGNLLSEMNLTMARYDLIFCRNVLIYFNSETQRQVIAALLAHLSSNGLLFLGHSETMVSLNLPVKSVAPAVFQHA